MQYSHKYLPELEQEWNWSERYAPQSEILTYANEIADRLDIRRDICFARQVTEARYDEAAQEWALSCDTGETVRAGFYIMATGCLSVPNKVDFPGKDSFLGPSYQTGQWPHEPVDFTGQRVAVIGKQPASGFTCVYLDHFRRGMTCPCHDLSFRCPCFRQTGRTGLTQPM